MAVHPGSADLFHIICLTLQTVAIHFISSLCFLVCIVLVKYQIFYFFSISFQKAAGCWLVSRLGCSVQQSSTNESK